MAWLKSNFKKMIEWPARSPDLNPVENLWKMISDIVYDGKTFDNELDLWDAIERACAKLMAEKREVLVNLTKSLPKRLLKVIKNKGGLTAY